MRQSLQVQSPIYAHSCAVIPKSVHKERIEEFTEAELLTWSLSAEQMATLDAMSEKSKICWNPGAIL